MRHAILEPSRSASGRSRDLSPGNTCTLSFPSEKSSQSFPPLWATNSFSHSHGRLSSPAAKMRYMNWDVLIFPETGETKTPLQEFSTACTVIQDPGKTPKYTLEYKLTSPALDSTTAPFPSHPSFFKSVTHPLPTVSCFVPSLLPGSPLRVSLHSWATPVASRATQAMAAHGNSAWFEAKVLLDGVCTA